MALTARSSFCSSLPLRGMSIPRLGSTRVSYPIPSPRSCCSFLIYRASVCYFSTTSISTNTSTTTSTSTQTLKTETEYPIVARRALDSRKHIVVLGTGWGGYQFMRSIDRSKFRVTCVSPRNHFLFTPLLASTTVGTLEYRAVIEPVRELSHLDYFAASVQTIDYDKQIVKCKDAFDARQFALEYDSLVIAVGAKSNTFNIPGVEQHAFFLKNINDARNIRNRILECFEKASHPLTNEEDKHRLTTFVVVGGGPTSIEFSGELYDFIRRDVKRKFPHVPSQIILIEATDHLLSSFDTRLSGYVEKTFQKRHITVMTKTQVHHLDQHSVTLSDGRTIPCGMVVWSTGLSSNDLIASLNWPKQPRSGRLLVDDHLRVILKLPTPPTAIPPLPYSKTPSPSPSDALPEGSIVMHNVYAIGDCATPINKNLPATAQVAASEARYLATYFNTLITSPTTTHPPFVYKSLGMLAYIGGYRALADLESFKGTGIGAWLFWRSAYLTRLLSIKNMILVPMYWFKAFVFGRDISRF